MANPSPGSAPTPLDSALRAAALPFLQGQGLFTAPDPGCRQLAAQLLATNRPFSQPHPGGHFTSSAIVVSPDSAHFLALFHPKHHAWMQPGGHLEPADASPLAAACREVEEETGFANCAVLNDTRPLIFSSFSVPARSHEPAHVHFDLRYLFCAPSPDFHSREGLTLAWLRFADIPTLDLDWQQVAGLTLARRHLQSLP